MPLHDGHGGEVDAVCHIPHRKNTRDVGLGKPIHLITHATMLQCHNVTMSIIHTLTRKSGAGFSMCVLTLVLNRCGVTLLGFCLLLYFCVVGM